MMDLASFISLGIGIVVGAILEWQRPKAPSGTSGYKLVPIEPTAAMLASACPDNRHKPGEKLSDTQTECVYITLRRRIWAEMLAEAEIARIRP